MNKQNIASRVRKARRRLDQSLKGNRVDKAGLPLPRVLARDEADRPVLIEVAGEAGHVRETEPYMVRLERHPSGRSVTVSCFSEQHEEHDNCCPGNTYRGNFCYHCFEALIVANWEAERRIVFCRGWPTAKFYNEQFLKNKGQIVELVSGQSGGTLCAISLPLTV